MKKVIVSPSLILEVVWVQQNIAAGNRHRSMRLIQSHWEPCLECNSILPDDPVEPAVELFFTTQHVKYACKGSHKRQRAGVEKKKSVLEQTCISFPWDEHKKKKKGKPAAHSSHSLQALSPWRQHKDILFCFASFLILSNGMKGGRNFPQEHQRYWTRTLACSEGLVSDLRGRFQCLVVSFLEIQQNHGPKRRRGRMNIDGWTLLQLLRISYFKIYLKSTSSLRYC